MTQRATARTAGLLMSWSVPTATADEPVAEVLARLREAKPAYAFFIPLVVSMADAVGTQTETVLVRALAHGDVPAASQILREGLLGLVIGVTVGAMAFPSLLVIRGEIKVATVVQDILSVAIYLGVATALL